MLVKRLTAEKSSGLLYAFEAQNYGIPMIETRRTTLYDVARRAGVSYQTVSRVINNHPSVSPETKMRVEEAIAALDYRPNRAAQSLAGAKSRTLAMITYGLETFGPAQMVVSIEQASRQAGYDLIFTNISDYHLANLRGAIDYIRRWEVDGLLLISPVEGLDYSEIAALCGNIPITLTGTQQGIGVPSIVVDQREGTQQVTRHLLDLGHTRLCEISGPMRWFDAQERHHGWKQTLAESNIEAGMSVEGDWTTRSGYQATRSLLQRGERFTALVAGNDHMALGAIHALREAGLRVPEDVSVVGFDDAPEAAYFAPPLTTVRQDFEQVGRLGVENLIARIGHSSDAAPQTVISPQLIVRESTANPRK